MKRHHLIFSILFILSPLIIFADNYVIINQVMYDARSAASSVSNGEYIDLYNAGIDTVSLAGWQLTGSKPTEKITLAETIPNGEHLIVACRRGNNAFRLDSVYTLPQDTNYKIVYQNKITLNNEGETITLINAQNDTIDRMYYDGESNASIPNRLSAPNTNGTPGDSCVSLHRTWVEFDAEGKVIHGTSRWKTEFVSFNTTMLPYDTYFEHNLIGEQTLPTGENYILSITPLDPTTRIDINDGQPSVSSGVRIHANLQYLDGLGRQDEAIALGTNPCKNDIVTVFDYYDKRNLSRQWMPVVRETDGQKINLTDIKTQAQTDYEDSRPFSEIRYENSGRKRPTEWIRQGRIYENNTATQVYNLNEANHVRIYTVNSDSSLYTDGACYNAAMLYKDIVSDEDGKSVISYTDKQGRKIMEERNGSCTYYVYDDLGRLRYVLPGLSSSELNGGNYHLQNPKLKAIAYCYNYDSIGNLTYKRLPGCEPQYMVYDRLGQLVLKQDGNQRAENKWTLCAYDSIGRNLYTAEIKLAQSHDYYISFFADKWQVEHYGGNQANVIPNTGYASSLLGTNDLRLLMVSYYDNYDYLSKIPTPMRQAIRFVQESGYGLQHDNATGLLTGTRVYNLSEDGYTATAYYYDAQSRIVQSRSTRSTDNYKTVTTTEYLFDGSIAQQLTEQGKNDDLVREHYRYAYDHAGRVKNVSYQLNNGAEITLSAFSYDSIGRLVQNLLYNKRDIITYSYDMRNMLTEAQNKHFTERLYYAGNLPSGVGACYNGNISATSIIYPDTAYLFAYTYDQCDRLLFSNRLTNYGTAYSEQFTYDNAGNVLSLKRFNNNQLMDSLEYYYGNEGNRLWSVTDNGHDGDVYDAIEYHNGIVQADTTMLYDANGNLIYDTDRDICAIHYNILNLPDTIQFTSGHMIVNMYDATGRKYKSIVYTNKASIIPQSYDFAHYSFETDSLYCQATEYTGNIETCTTKDSVITIQRRIHNAIGYYADSTYYHYIKDHLGNICAVVHSAADTLVQNTMYYASGVPMSQSYGRDRQPYLYNGKEFVEAHGLNTYDYGYRGYYAPVGRFTGIDPLAEQTPWQSPYSYAGNRFVNAIDWMGLGGLTSMADGNVRHYIVIDKYGNYLGGEDNDDNGIYLSPDGKWEPKDGINGLERVGRMMFPFWLYENWIGKGHKASGLYYDNRCSVSVSGSIGWQISFEKFIGISVPSWELFDLSMSIWSYSEGFEWGEFKYDYILNEKEYKTTIGAQVYGGYEYSVKHNVITDSPVYESLSHIFSIGPVYFSSDGTFGITLTIAVIGGVSISITGNLYYESNE